MTISNSADGETWRVMRLVTSCIDPQELGIDILKVRRTKAGAILIEFSGKERLTSYPPTCVKLLDKELQLTDLRITPVLVINIPDWLDDDRVRSAIVAAHPYIDSSRISLRENSGGGKVAKLMVDMEIALKLSALKSINIVYNLCLVKLLEVKEPTCYRCQARGHIAAACMMLMLSQKSVTNGLGHLAAKCQGTRL